MLSEQNQWLKTLFLWIPILLVLVLLTVVLSVSVGSAELTFQTVWKVIVSKLPFFEDQIQKNWKESTEVIVWNIRMPRIMLGLLIGAALSASGVAYQGVLRNPLAEPYILGVSAGAALGAALVIVTGWQSSLLGKWSLPAVAFFTGILTLTAVYRLAKIQNKIQIETLILSGVVVQAFIASALSLVLALSEEKMQMIMFWLMGSLSLTDWSYIWIILPYVVIGIVIIWLFSRELNIMALGEEEAYHLGVSVEKVRVILLITASLITGAAVSVSGTIGFVGLVVPHIIRLLFGSDHRIVLPLSILIGAIFVVGADTIARTIMAPRELPIGIITAFLGAPFFGYLLRKKKSGYF